jgi:hypothetical protein
MDHAALPLGWACPQRHSIRKSARSALTSINSNNLHKAQDASICAPLTAIQAGNAQHLFQPQNHLCEINFKPSLTVLSRIESQKSISAKPLQLTMNSLTQMLSIRVEVTVQTA